MLVWIIRRYDGGLIDAVFTNVAEAYYQFGDSDEWYIQEWHTHEPLPAKL